MEKPVIGIVGSFVSNKERAFQNYTKINDYIPLRIIENGGIPIGILFPFGKFNEEDLNVCDGIILQGGSNITSAHLNVVNYALKNKIPLLGICMGMQVIGAYEWFSNIYGLNLTSKEIDDNFKAEYENLFLEKICFHNINDPFYNNNVFTSKHPVILEKDSVLYDIIKNNLNVVSVHNFALKEKTLTNLYFKITGRSLDNVIEIIESIDKNRFVLGVQFHPEILKEDNFIFKIFIDQVKKHKRK